MRRLLIVLAFLSAYGYAQTCARRDDFVQSSLGQAIAGTTVTYYAQSGIGVAASGTPATIYSEGTCTNVITAGSSTADNFGHAVAYMTAGYYTITYVSPYIQTQTLIDQNVAGGSGGGGGSCPGSSSNTQVLFNSSGSCAGSPNFTWDGTQAIVGVTNLQSFVGQGYFNVSQNQPFASIVEPLHLQLSYTDNAGAPAAPTGSVTTTEVDQFGQIKTHNSLLGGGGFLSPGGGGGQEYHQDAGGSTSVGWDVLNDVHGDSETQIGVRANTDDSSLTTVNAGSYGGQFNVSNTKTSTALQIGVSSTVTSGGSTRADRLIGFYASVPIGSPAYYSDGGRIQLTEEIFSSIGTCGGTGGPQAGAIMAVSDSSTATWGATITGSGSNHVLAFCNGTNWTVMAK